MHHKRTDELPRGFPTCSSRDTGAAASGDTAAAAIQRYTLMYYKKSNVWALRQTFGERGQVFQLQPKLMSKEDLHLVAEECRNNIEVDGWDETAANMYGQERLAAAAR